MWQCHLFVFWMGISVSCSTKIFEGFAHLEQLDEKQCHTSDVLFRVTHQSLLGCGYACERTTDCMGFTYNVDNEACVGCGGEHGNWTTFGLAIGTKFYIGEWFNFGEFDYKLSRTNLSFYDAVSYCNKARGQIATVDTEEKNAFIVKTLEAFGIKESEWFNFGGHWYKLSTTNMTFLEGLVYCNTSRGQIATLDTEAENEFIIQKLLALEIEGNVWIGLTDEAEEGVWTWVTTGEVANYTNWKTDGDHPQPNGWDEDNCVNLAKGYRFEWADKKCSKEQRVLCERLVD